MQWISSLTHVLFLCLALFLFLFLSCLPLVLVSYFNILTILRPPVCNGSISHISFKQSAIQTALIKRKALGPLSVVS